MISSPQRNASSQVDRDTSNSREHNARSNSKEGEFSDSQYKSRLLGTKVAAKEVEKEALTLKNRIALLEKEEQKVLKKIEGAKKQALDIMSKKQRNQKFMEEKEKTQHEQNTELEQKKQLINLKKDEMKEKLKEAVTEKTLNSKEKANEIKESLRVTAG